MRSQPLSLHLVRSTYTFIDADCLLSIVLHPYYKLAYIELAWGGAKEQEAELRLEILQQRTGKMKLGRFLRKQ